MKTSHTPGPWRADYNAEGDWEIHAATEHSEFSFWIATVHAETPKEQTEANARLIAAAPELLEALQGLLDQIENGKPFTGSREDMERKSVETARAAIAKATRSPSGDTQP